MAKITLEVGEDEDTVTEGVFVCHVLGEDGLEVRTVPYNAPSGSTRIGMLVQALDRTRAVQAERWE